MQRLDRDSCFRFKAELVTQPREKIVHLCWERKREREGKGERALCFWVGIDTKMTLHLISGTFFLPTRVSYAGRCRLFMDRLHWRYPKFISHWSVFSK